MDSIWSTQEEQLSWQHQLELRELLQRLASSILFDRTQHVQRVWWHKLQNWQVLWFWWQLSKFTSQLWTHLCTSACFDVARTLHSNPVAIITTLNDYSDISLKRLHLPTVGIEGSVYNVFVHKHGLVHGFYFRSHFRILNKVDTWCNQQWKSRQNIHQGKYFNP